MSDESKAESDNSIIEVGGLGGGIKIPVLRAEVSKAAKWVVLAFALSVVIGTCGGVAYLVITALRSVPSAAGR